MPFDIKKDNRCPASKPWAVVNSDNQRLHGCHATHAQAREQQKALYANVPDADRSAREDQSPEDLLAGLDATLDEALKLTQDVDRATLPPEVGQALDLLRSAGSSICALMQAMGVYDPDDEDEEEDALLAEALNLQYILSFDYRSDAGPLIVGPFPSREAAVDHARTLEPLEAEWCAVPVTPPM